jgi:hypothetical protein
MRWAPAILLVAVGAGWVGQGWTAYYRPDRVAQAELLDQLAGRLEPGDELAYLPAWELGWAIELERRFSAHARRLGLLDLLRPAARIWVISSPDAPPVPAALGVPQEALVVGRIKAERYGFGAGVLPRVEAWQQGRCRLSAKRTSCATDAGQVRRGELVFDGRFAQGHKLTLKDDVALELRWTPPAAGQLIGGIGHTDHGARHGRSPVQVTLSQAGKELGRWTLQPTTGLRPVAVEVVGGSPLTLTFRCAKAERNEAVFSFGFAP